MFEVRCSIVRSQKQDVRVRSPTNEHVRVRSMFQKWCSSSIDVRKNGVRPITKKFYSAMTTDLGSQIRIFDCRFSTLWIFSNFPALLIFHEINSGYIQKVTNCRYKNFGGLEFWFLEKFHTWKCQKFPKIQDSERRKWSKWQFLGLQNDQNTFSRKIWVAEKAWNFHILYLPIPY